MDDSEEEENLIDERNREENWLDLRDWE